MAEKLIGKVSHYFDKINVAVVKLTAAVALGDELIFRKGEEEVMQTLESIQIDNESLQKAKAGDVVGVEVHTPVKPGTEVYKK